MDKAPDDPCTILLVEDNQAHAELIIRIFEHHHIPNQIIHVQDGEAALDYLFRQGTYADAARAPRPHIVLLDLRLPRIDGLDVLKAVKTSETLHNIPVVILTTSEANTDAARAYEEHANSFVIKPLDFTRFSELIQEMGFYWLRWNHFPWF